MKIAPVILAGGAGTRLWPLSREDKPKQFQDLTGKGSLLGATINRLSSLNPDKCIIATSTKYKEMSSNEFKNMDINGTVLSEPYPRNTAPAVLYASIYLSKLYKDSIMIILPADHYIKKEDVFTDIIKTAINEAKNDSLVTIGIKPIYPETGYGYIKAINGKGQILKVERFVEKPDKQKAEEYLANGNYYWNGGIFVWKTSVIINYFKELMPDLYEAFAPLVEITAEQISSIENDTYSIIESIFSSIDSISIDYGIMEKAKNKKVIPADFGWTDLGSWNSIDDILIADENGNRTPDNDRSIFLSSSNCSVFAEGKSIALIGVENLVVVESGDSILVMNKNNNQEVREVVEIIKDRKKNNLK